MTPVHLYNEEKDDELDFKSLKEAALFLGVPYQNLYIAFKRGIKCNGYAVTLGSHKRAHSVMMEYDVPREELDIPHYANIDGKGFVAVKCTDKTKCTECDIYKLQPPRTMIQYPLCYDYNCGTHKIVDVCSKYKCIWKRKRKSTSLK